MSAFLILPILVSFISSPVGTNPYIKEISYEYDHDYNNLVSGFEKRVFDMLALELHDDGSVTNTDSHPYKYMLLTKNGLPSNRLSKIHILDTTSLLIKDMRFQKRLAKNYLILCRRWWKNRRMLNENEIR